MLSKMFGFPFRLSIRNEVTFLLLLKKSRYVQTYFLSIVSGTVIIEICARAVYEFLAQKRACLLIYTEM